MPKILSNLDLSKNELQNVVIQKLNSAPSNAIEGQIYYNTLSKNLYRYDGTNWVTYQADLSISGTTSVDTLSIDNAPTASSNNLVTSGGVYTAIQNVGGLPSQTGNNGKFLTTDGSAASWANVPTEIFWCTYGTTTDAEIAAALTAGKLCLVKFRGSWSTSDACTGVLVAHSTTIGYVFTCIDYYTGGYSTNNVAICLNDSWSQDWLNLTPQNHATNATSYGLGTSTNYGHLKLSDSTSSNSSTNGGIAATPAAVKSAYDRAGTLMNRTTAVNTADTNYTTLIARGESLNSAETTPAVNGAIAWTYE